MKCWDWRDKQEWTIRRKAIMAMTTRPIKRSRSDVTWWVMINRWIFYQEGLTRRCHWLSSLITNEGSKVLFLKKMIMITVHISNQKGRIQTVIKQAQRYWKLTPTDSKRSHDKPKGHDQPFVRWAGKKDQKGHAEMSGSQAHISEGWGWKDHRGHKTSDKVMMIPISDQWLIRRGGEELHRSALHVHTWKNKKNKRKSRSYIATKIPFMYSFSGNCTASAVPISTFTWLWAIYIFPLLVHIYPPLEWADRSWEYINRSQTQNVEIGTVAAQILFWEYFFPIFDSGSLQCKRRQNNKFKKSWVWVLEKLTSAAPFRRHLLEPSSQQPRSKTTAQSSG